MNTCAAPGCLEATSQRCSSCNRCSRFAVVSIFDSQVLDSSMSFEELPTSSGEGAHGWELCPVVNMLGVPLAIKKVAPCGCQVCVGRHSPIPEARNQVATRLAIEPHNGLAPPRWQGGPHNHLGTVVAARTDFGDFTGEDWRILDNYIFNNIFDVWGMEPSERNQLLPRVYSKQTFTHYAAAASRSPEELEEAAYEAAFGGGFVG